MPDTRRPSAVLAERVRAGDVRALARVCRMIDDRVKGYRELLRELFPHTNKAWILGITGAPGAGKSTLTDALIRQFRARDERVGVLAVDPTSPFSGGAILGDRIRMQQHFEDSQVFIRSLATRGALGGLSRSATDLICPVAAWGAGVVLVETVGVGQDELEITRAAHTTLVVMAPGLGDDIQAVKAGIMECADVFAVNKADLAGADATVSDIEQMLALGARPSTSSLRHSAATVAANTPAGHWVPPIVKCVATRGEGMHDLLQKLDAHRRWLEQTPEGAQQRAGRAHAHLLQTLQAALADELLARLEPEIAEAARRVEAREIDPYSACEDLLEKCLIGPR
jgi:LAO/AO transport system kinase